VASTNAAFVTPIEPVVEFCMMLNGVSFAHFRIDLLVAEEYGKVLLD